MTNRTNVALLCATLFFLVTACATSPRAQVDEVSPDSAVALDSAAIIARQTSDAASARATSAANATIFAGQQTATSDARTRSAEDYRATSAANAIAANATREAESFRSTATREAYDRAATAFALSVFQTSEAIAASATESSRHADATATREAVERSATREAEAIARGQTATREAEARVASAIAASATATRIAATIEEEKNRSTWNRNLESFRAIGILVFLSAVAIVLIAGLVAGLVIAVRRFSLVVEKDPTGSPIIVATRIFSSTLSIISAARLPSGIAVLRREDSIRFVSEDFSGDPEATRRAQAIEFAAQQRSAVAAPRVAGLLPAFTSSRIQQIADPLPNIVPAEAVAALRNDWNAEEGGS